MQVQVMKTKRKVHDNIIENFQKTQQQIDNDKLISKPGNVSDQIIFN